MQSHVPLGPGKLHVVVLVLLKIYILQADWEAPESLKPQLEKHILFDFFQ